jgi:predicted protein tyrosine phosphatase
MNHPPVLALGYSEASMLLRGQRAPFVKAIISIQGLHEVPIDAPSVPDRLTLHFDDVDPPHTNDRVAFYRAWVQKRWAKEVGRPLRPPTAQDARAIVEFAWKIRDINDGIVLCQCGAGMSRSPAAALLCLAAWTGVGNERYCVDEVLRVRPGATPLMGLVMLGDAELGLEGRLIIAAMERRAGGGAATR